MRDCVRSSGSWAHRGGLYGFLKRSMMNDVHGTVENKLLSLFLTAWLCGRWLGYSEVSASSSCMGDYVSGGA